MRRDAPAPPAQTRLWLEVGRNHAGSDPARAGVVRRWRFHELPTGPAPGLPAG